MALLLFNCSYETNNHERTKDFAEYAGETAVIGIWNPMN